MALCLSGALSLGGSTLGRSIACELGLDGTTEISLNDAAVRDLAGISSGEISVEDFYGCTKKPGTLGEEIEGGYYIGTSAVSTGYYLIVAPNSGGATTGRYNNTGGDSGSTSNADGYFNTYCELNLTIHPGANFAAGRSTSGCTDWYSPAIDEMDQFYNNRLTLPAGQEFSTGRTGFTWSSTERANNTACGKFIYGGFAGQRSDRVKFCTYNHRIGRRVPF